MSPTTTGARSTTGRTRKPLGWLPWVLLLVLALVIALVVLIVVGSNDNDDDANRDTRPATLIVPDPLAA